jgi:hypothetical protein
VTLSGKRPPETCPRCRVGEPPEPRWLGAYLLALGPWLVSYAEQEPKAGLGLLVDREPEARVSPRALSRGRGVLRLSRISWPEGVRERT